MKVNITTSPGVVNMPSIAMLLCLNVSNPGFCHGLSFVEITDPETEKAILNEFHSCPLVTTVFSLSGFEYNLVICLVGEKREQIDKFIDVSPLSKLDGVKRRNTFMAKRTEGFTEKPFWIPLSPEPEKTRFDSPWCERKCESCPLVERVKTKLVKKNYH